LFDFYQTGVLIDKHSNFLDDQLFCYENQTVLDLFLSKPYQKQLKLIEFFLTFIIQSEKRNMKSKTTTKSKNIKDNQEVKESSDNEGSIVKKTKINPIHAELADEGQEDFYSYLEWLGLAKKPDLLILTRSHHYYFEVEDLKNVKTVVNLNQLNNIKNIREFLQAIYNVMPHKCFFIGSFTDNKQQNAFLTSKRSLHQIEKMGYMPEPEEGAWNSFLNMLYGIIDLKTTRSLSKKTVQFMLEDTGLKIIDITEFNGLTYFCTQKDKPSVE
jgi:hypothetical protein